MSDETKFCKHCNTEHPLTSEFWQWNSSRQKFETCKKQKSDYMLAFKRANPEKVKNRNRAWKTNNQDKVKASAKIYKKSNSEKIKKSAKEYYQSTIEKQKEYRKRTFNHRRETLKVYREKNRDIIKEKKKKYYEKNIEKIQLKRKENRKKINQKINTRKQLDPIFKLSRTLRNRLWQILKFKGVKKSSSAIRHLGCTLEELKKHLELQFQPGMSWENWSRDGWHVDHKRPLNSFNLLDLEQQKLASHYTNLQPLWCRDNLSKGDKYNEKDVG